MGGKDKDSTRTPLDSARLVYDQVVTATVAALEKIPQAETGRFRADLLLPIFPKRNPKSAPEAPVGPDGLERDSVVVFAKQGPSAETTAKIEKVGRNMKLEVIWGGNRLA